MRSRRCHGRLWPAERRTDRPREPRPRTLFVRSSFVFFLFLLGGGEGEVSSSRQKIKKKTTNRPRETFFFMRKRNKNVIGHPIPAGRTWFKQSRLGRSGGRRRFRPEEAVDFDGVVGAATGQEQRCRIAELQPLHRRVVASTATASTKGKKRKQKEKPNRSSISVVPVKTR